MDYLQLGITPINDQNAEGEDVRYDEEFELLEAEMAKLVSPTIAESIDWDRVIKLSQNILEKKSKHLLVAVYLSYALIKKNGIESLAVGSGVVANLLKNYWETLFPQKRRMKGRINAIEWWLDKIVHELEHIDTIEVQEDIKNESLSNLKEIDDFLNEKLEEAPLFYNLIKSVDMKFTLKEVQKEIQVEEKVVEIVEEKETLVKKEPASEPMSEEKKETRESTPRKSFSKSNDLEKDLEGVVENLNQITASLLESKDYRSELFIANRAFAWLDIENLPASEKNITMLNPPDSQEIELIESLYNDAKYEALLWSAESRITTYLFWLDLHFYVATALEKLGFTLASRSIHTQVEYFIEKLPNVENLKFSDSLPFANKKTKKWLQKEKAKVEVSPVLGSVSDEEFSSMDAISKKIHQASSVEEEVLYTIKMCRFLLKEENRTLIEIYTKKLLARIEEYSTERWNPTIALEAYTLSVESLRTIEADDAVIDAIIEKIALLKPSVVDTL